MIELRISNHHYGLTAVVACLEGLNAAIVFTKQYIQDQENCRACLPGCVFGLLFFAFAIDQSRTGHTYSLSYCRDVPDTESRAYAASAGVFPRVEGDGCAGP